MSTLITKAIQTKNAAYAANFKDGNKPLPPAKKYLVLVRRTDLTNLSLSRLRPHC